MKIYSIAKGRSRIVILIPFLHIAIKFARTKILDLLWTALRDIFNGRSSREVFLMSQYLWRAVAINGVRENLCERKLWRRTRNPLLVPTYLSFGFVNIAKLAEGRKPEGSEWITQLTLLMESHNWVSIHSFANHSNYLIDSNGKLRLLDYGIAQIGPVIERFGERVYREFDENRILTEAEIAQRYEFERVWRQSRGQ